MENLTVFSRLLLYRPLQGSHRPSRPGLWKGYTGTGNMPELSIRGKMIAVIALLLFAMTGLGLLAVLSLRAINAHTEQIANNWLPSVRVLGELRAAINLNRAQLRAHMMATATEERGTFEKAMKVTLAVISDARSSYRLMTSSPEQKALFENWSITWED
jgi:methyl-accepting chemotaxis protein